MISLVVGLAGTSDQMLSAISIARNPMLYQPKKRDAVLWGMAWLDPLRSGSELVSQVLADLKPICKFSPSGVGCMSEVGAPCGGYFLCMSSDAEALNGINALLLL